jgi:UrcA family protein
MSTEAYLLRRLSRARTAIETAVVTTFLAMIPFAALADQRGATVPAPGVAEVSLADLNLATPDGIHRARDRLYTEARRLCAEPAGERLLEPSFTACVDSTMANALRQTKGPASNVVIRAADVSIADLDLATTEGLRAARVRLEPVARRLCSELVHGRGLSYQPSFPACVSDSLAGALAQVKALAAARALRTARVSPSQNDRLDTKAK